MRRFTLFSWICLGADELSIKLRSRKKQVAVSKLENRPTRGDDAKGHELPFLCDKYKKSLVYSQKLCRICFNKCQAFLAKLG